MVKKIVCTVKILHLVRNKKLHLLLRFISENLPTGDLTILCSLTSPPPLVGLRSPPSPQPTINGGKGWFYGQDTTTCHQQIPERCLHFHQSFPLFLGLGNNKLSTCLLLLYTNLSAVLFVHCTDNTFPLL